MLRPSFMTFLLAMKDSRARLDATHHSRVSAAWAPGRHSDGRGEGRGERVASDASPRYGPLSIAQGSTPTDTRRSGGRQTGGRHASSIVSLHHREQARTGATRAPPCNRQRRRRSGVDVGGAALAQRREQGAGRPLPEADALEERRVGVRVPSWDFSATTLPLIRELGLLYDSSLMADDEPYELLDDGVATGIVELPVEWIKDDAPYLGMNRATAIRPYTAPSAVLEIFRAEFEGALAEGGLFLLTMHPHIIGHRSRIAILEELIRYMKGMHGVWFATHEEVARYCKATA